MQVQALIVASLYIVKFDLQVVGARTANAAATPVPHCWHGGLKGLSGDHRLQEHYVKIDV